MTQLIECDRYGDVHVLRLDAPPLNTIGFELLDELVDAIHVSAKEEGVRGIIITGDDTHFSAGADVRVFTEIKDATEAARVSRVYQEALGVIEDCGVPAVAAVAGNVMGCALELAMACHYRVCDEATRFSSPEARLGINPGAGGTQRLPRLVGVGPALDMMLTGRSIKAPQAKEMGLVDAVCSRGQLVERARELIATSSSPIRTCDRIDRIDDAAANEAAFKQARMSLARVRREVIAPAGIIECVRKGIDESFDVGLVAEQTTFGACMETEATRNLIHLFFASRRVGRAPEAESVRIKSPAVVGMGSMGTGIAHALIISGYPVVVLDENDEALERGVSKIRASIDKRVGEGKLARGRADTMLGLITTTTSWNDLSGADIVIEAVFEKIEVKTAALAQIENACSPETLIASNTSMLSFDDLARGMTYPERLVGMHFFNPAHAMPLVEIIRRDETPDSVIAAATNFAKSIRKMPALVRNSPGFIVNRVFVPYLNEAFYLLEDGANPFDIDAAVVMFGMPMGPLALIDMAGIDILAFSNDVLLRAFPSRGSQSPIISRLVDEGRLGQKTGAGVYQYEKGDRRPHPSETTAAIIADAQASKSIIPRAIDRDEITARLVLRMVCEVFHVLDEGVAERESDIDIAMVLGTGFPDFRGGVLRYARNCGLDNIKARLAELTEQFGERFAPGAGIHTMKGME